MSVTATETWVPSSQQELEGFQRKIVQHLMSRNPGLPRKVLVDEIVPDAFADGYAKYLELAADPTLDVTDPEGYLTTVCVNQAQNLLRSYQRQGRRFEIRPGTTEKTEEGEFKAGPSLEAAAAADLDLTEKFATASEAIRNDRKNALLTTMAKLPDGQREAFLLHVVDGKSVPKAAEEAGIGVRPFEKRLRKAISQVAWAVAQTSGESLCPDCQAIRQEHKDPDNPTRDEQLQIVRHIQACSNCRTAMYESPFAIDLGALLATGAFTAHAGPTLGERITSLPVVEMPTEMARSVWDKVWPGTTHGTEAAVGGTAAAGTGGTILAVGGGKAILTLCAGVATTACVAGVATGVIPVTKSDADKNPAERAQPTPATSQSTFVDSRAEYESTRAAIEQTIDRRAAKREAKQKAKAAAKAAAAAAAAEETTVASSGSESDQASYSSPVTTTPTTQAETNSSAASSSFGVGGGGSTSSGSSSSSSSSSGQTQTNQQSANDSFGIGG